VRLLGISGTQITETANAAAEERMAEPDHRFLRMSMTQLWLALPRK
jgi:hypothetical protein